MKTALLAAAALALPLTAHAQTRTEAAFQQFRAEAATAPLAPIKVSAKSATPVSDLADPRLFLAKAPDDQSQPARPRGTVQTAIDHRFSADRDKDVTGSLGYLCGLQPGFNEAGGAASSYEPMGTFLGGQLKVAF